MVQDGRLRNVIAAPRRKAPPPTHPKQKTKKASRLRALLTFAQWKLQPGSLQATSWARRQQRTRSYSIADLLSRGRPAQDRAPCEMRGSSWKPLSPAQYVALWLWPRCSLPAPRSGGQCRRSNGSGLARGASRHARPQLTTKSITVRMATNPWTLSWRTKSVQLFSRLRLFIIHAGDVACNMSSCARSRPNGARRG